MGTNSSNNNTELRTKDEQRTQNNGSPIQSTNMYQQGHWVLVVTNRLVIKQWYNRNARNKMLNKDFERWANPVARKARFYSRGSCKIATQLLTLAWLLKFHHYWTTSQLSHENLAENRFPISQCLSSIRQAERALRNERLRKIHWTRALLQEMSHALFCLKEEIVFGSK